MPATAIDDLRAAYSRVNPRYLPMFLSLDDNQIRNSAVLNADRARIQQLAIERG